MGPLFHLNKRFPNKTNQLIKSNKSKQITMGKGGDASAALSSRRDHQLKQLPKFTWKDVKEHASPSDAWIVYHNKVYDVSNWHDHPGGAVVFTRAGDDATDIFAAFHAPGSQNLLKKFLIGDLIVDSVEHKDARQHAFEKAYRDLRSQLIVMGMFKGNFWFYVYKQLFNLSMWASALVMMTMSNNGFVHVAAALWMGLFFQQCGWLAHDFLHHQVYKKRRHGDYSGLFWGGVMQGFSAQWWKNKHNGHHAVPNLINSSPSAQDGDPDIDTMPVLAWSLKQAQSFRELQADGKDSAFVKFMIRNQKYFYLDPHVVVVVWNNVASLARRAHTAGGPGHLNGHTCRCVGASLLASSKRGCTDEKLVPSVTSLLGVFDIRNHLLIRASRSRFSPVAVTALAVSYGRFTSTAILETS